MDWLRKHIYPVAFLFIFLFVPSSRLSASPVDSLFYLDEGKWAAQCWRIYTSYIKPLDSLAAFKALEEMQIIAKKKSSASLHAYALFFKGKYCYDKHYWKNNLPIRYFKEAIALPDCPKFLEAEAIFYTGIWQYYSEHNYPIAFENLLRSSSMMEELGYREFPNADELLMNLGIAYYQFGEFEKARRHLLQSLEMPVSKAKNKVEIYNTIGLVYRDLKNFDSAMQYFIMALNTASGLKDTAWIGIISGNLGHIYYKSGKSKEALEFLYRDYSLSTQNNQNKSAANAALLISQIYFENGKMDAAQWMLETGRKMAYRCEDLRVYMLLYRNLARFYKYKGDDKKALLYTDSLILLKDSLAYKNDAAMLEKAKNKTETEAYLANLRLLEIEKNKQILVRNGILGMAFLLSVIGWQAFRRTRLKQKKDMEILHLEKQRSNEALENAQLQLMAYVESVKQKNQLLEKFTAEMEQLQKMPGNAVIAEKEEILKRLQDTTILTEQEWQDFKKMFTKVHARFFISLNEKFPHLTQSEIRLLALSKLGLSINEKANVLGISPDSVRRAHQRLNKKVHLSEEEIFDELVF